MASAIANTLVYPLDLSKTLIQTQVKPRATSMKMSESTASVASELSDPEESLWHQKRQKDGELRYKSVVDALTQIYRKKGILGWYHGLISSILGSAAQNFSYFYWYTIVKRMYARFYRHIPNHRSGTVTELFLGALAAAISQMFTMPIGVITTQQQTDKHHKGLVQLTREVLEHDGITGLWKGLRVSLVLCVNPSITYGSYERLKQVLYANKEYLGPLESFSIGVIAKSMATLATQPLIVSKAMLQKKSHPGSEDEDIKFDSFQQALVHLWHTEKLAGLYKGIAPQLVKGVFVQGLLFMFKDQIDLAFLALLRIAKKK